MWYFEKQKHTFKPNRKVRVKIQRFNFILRLAFSDRRRKCQKFCLKFSFIEFEHLSCFCDLIGLIFSLKYRFISVIEETFW